MFQRDWLRVLASVGATVVVCSATRAGAQDAGSEWLDGNAPSGPTNEKPPPEPVDLGDPVEADGGSGERAVPPPPPPRGAEDLETDSEITPVQIFEPEEFEEATPASNAGPNDSHEHENQAPVKPSSLRRRYSGPPTLLGNGGPIEYGGYGGVDVRWSRIAGNDALLVGGEGALLLDHRLAIGIGGFGLANLIPSPRSSNGNRSYLGLGYGGLVMRHNFVNERLVYLSVGTLVGAGGVGFFEVVDDYEYKYDEDEFDEDPFFIVEPSLGLHLNVTEWMRVGASISYRFTKGIDCEGLTDHDFRGPTAGGHVQFGWF